MTPPESAESAHTSSQSYGPSRPMALALATGAVVAAGAAIATSAATGRLLLIIAAVVLAAVAGTDLVFAPRLRASERGLRISSPTLRVTLGWDEVDSITVDERSRHGLANRTLEIESGERLIVLSGRSLGRDPRDVYAELVRLRAS
jgi:Bacterial PH domain